MSVRKERIGVWLFAYFISLVGSMTLSSLLIEHGYGLIAKIFFLWVPFIAIALIKSFEGPIFGKYVEAGDHAYRVLRKNAPKRISILINLAPIMAFFMLGYAFAHLYKHGSI